MKGEGIDLVTLDGFNIPQGKEENRVNLDKVGGVDGLLDLFGIDPKIGLTTEQVKKYELKYGNNTMPASPKKSYLQLLLAALSDTTLIILLCGASVSFGIGYWEHPDIGWIEGLAIFIAVFLVSNISAFNDYSKEIQFRQLEASSAQDQQVSVLRNGDIEQINPCLLVVGDILVLGSGDQIPADSVIIDSNEIFCSESALTGEPIDLKKKKDKDCFLLSSCLITDGPGCKAMVIGVGINSQWGKIKANLVTESVNTPLQNKLQLMTKRVSNNCILSLVDLLILFYFFKFI